MTTKPLTTWANGQTPAQVAAQLRRKGAQYNRLVTEVDNALHDLKVLALESVRAGVTMSQIARDAQMNRSHLYRLLAE